MWSSITSCLRHLTADLQPYAVQHSGTFELPWALFIQSSNLMRGAKACVQCRATKRRCEAKQQENQPCRQCLQRSTECSFSRSSRSAAHLAARVSDVTTPPAALLPELERRREVVDLYLNNIHDKPHTLFHVPTIRAQVLDQSCLLYTSPSPRDGLLSRMPSSA